MNKRKITDPFNVKFQPFDNYGSPITGMSWHKITYSKKKGQGTYILKMDPGAKSKLHRHTSFEEFIILVLLLTTSFIHRPFLFITAKYFPSLV